jgi:glutathione S-transferase
MHCGGIRVEDDPEDAPYVFPVAPNPTKVRLHLVEKRVAGTPLDVEEHPVDLTRGEQRGPEHLGRNPRGTLPVLELDDGSYLTDGRSLTRSGS